MTLILKLLLARVRMRRDPFGTTVAYMSADVLFVVLYPVLWLGSLVWACLRLRHLLRSMPSMDWGWKEGAPRWAGLCEASDDYHERLLAHRAIGLRTIESSFPRFVQHRLARWWSAKFEAALDWAECPF